MLTISSKPGRRRGSWVQQRCMSCIRSPAAGLFPPGVLPRSGGTGGRFRSASFIMICAGTQTSDAPLLRQHSLHGVQPARRLAWNRCLKSIHLCRQNVRGWTEHGVGGLSSAGLAMAKQLCGDAISHIPSPPTDMCASCQVHAC